MDISNKQHIKGYDLRDRIGTGGFGAVYKAYQSTVGREVAIKIILPGLANQPDFIRRFESEAQLVARLEHPYIVPLHDYWRDPEGAYLVMRWLRGGSLRDALQNGAFELRAAALLLDQIAGALSLAHRNGVIHRDIKPGNILLDEDGNAYLTDFGIAKDLNIVTDNTQQDAIIGSLDYISPEQARSEPVTPRTDIYSLGVTLYEIITGHHPFENMSSVERLYKHINDPLPEITTLEPGLQEAINRVIQKATVKKPENRYPDALALAADFREAVGMNRTSTTLVELLTQREQEILKLIIDGLSNKEIAQQLTVTLATVKWHVYQIYGKLGVRSRVQAIVRARELNLITKPGETIHAAPIPTEDFYPENPYKGLLAFQSADYQDFFGRETVTAKLVKRLGETGDQRRFLAVVGPSGSGKSSLVKAGLIPALWRGDLPGSEKWFVVEMLPGARPLDELEITLTKVAADQSSNLHEHLLRDKYGLTRAASLILPNDGSELVLVIDQFEEVFTLLEDETARVHFLDLLYAAVTELRSRVRVVITLRADFYDRPLHYPKFGELVRTHLETIMPLSAEELERAIARPAERVGVTFEPGLVAAIIGDVSYQPGALPLLQYALTELFEQRKGRLLLREAYQAIGGTVGALAKRAEEVYLDLDNEDREAARQLFLRLVTLGEGTEDTRRRAARAELQAVSSDADMMDEIIDTFAAYRLLSMDTDPGTRTPTVEVAHEALLREWERLRTWLNESRDEIKLQRQLSSMAEEWRDANKDASFLARGSRLEQFETWVAETKLFLTQREHDYLNASLTERERQIRTEKEQQAREQRLERRSQNFLRGLVGVFAVAALLSIGLSVFASGERKRAEENADYARSIALASAAKSSHLSNSPDQAIALAVAAYTSTDHPSAFVQSVLYETAFAPAARRVLTGHSFSATLSPDGRSALSWNFLEDSSLTYWDIETGRVIYQTPPLMEGNITDGVIFAPDGKTVYVSVFTPDYVPLGVIELDVVTGREIGRLAEPEERYAVGIVALSPDGQTLLTASGTGSGLNGTFRSGPLTVWNVATGSVIRQFAATGMDGDISSISFSPDGKQAIVGYFETGTAILWDVFTGERIQTISAPSGTLPVVHITSEGILTLVVQPDFTMTLTLWEIETGTKLREHVWPNPVNGTDLHPDGNSIALAFFGAPVTVFDLQAWQITNELYGHGNTVTTVNFSSDGRLLLSGSFDGNLRLWNVDNGSEIRQLTGLSDAHVVGFLMNPDGRTALTQQFNGPMTLWDMETGEMIRQWGDTFSSYAGIAFSSDGQYIVSGSAAVLGECPAPEGRLKLWDTATGDLIWEAETGGNATTGKAFINGNTQIATADWRCTNNVTIWDVATGEKVDEWEGHQNTIFGLNVSTDGTMVVSGAEDNAAIVWDAATGAIIQKLVHDDAVRTGMFSPDGSQLVTVVDNGVLHLWDTATWQEQKQLTGHSSSIIFVQYSPDGEYLVSSGRDNNIFVWDLQIGEAVRHFQLTQVSPMGHVVAFSPDGQSLLFNDEKNVIHQVDLMLEPDELLNWVNSNRYVRDLTCSERSLYRLEPQCQDEGAE